MTLLLRPATPAHKWQHVHLFHASNCPQTYFVPLFTPQVRLRLLHFFASEIQQHGLGVSKATLQAMVSLASLPSPSDTELKLAEQAQQYL